MIAKTTEELLCEAVELAKASSKVIEENDTIVFGGWIMGGMINGLDKIKKMNPKKLIVFAVGSTPEELIDIDAMKQQNQLQHIPLYYMIGGFRFEQLNFAVKGMLKMLKKSAAKKENKTPQEEYMAEILGTSFEKADHKYIEPIVKCAILYSQR